MKWAFPEETLEGIPKQRITSHSPKRSGICLVNGNEVPTGSGAAESSGKQLWLFILLAIATAGRGERVSRVQFQCMTWFADVAQVQIPTSKSDILGLMSYMKMCSANPLHPLCCLVTALGVEFVSAAILCNETA
jgi:hypothetical protein